jgi:hypothetical protein
MEFSPRKRPTESPDVVVVPPRPGTVHWTLVIGAVVLFGWLFVWLAAVLIATTNPDPRRQDQKNNMRQALLTRPLIHPDWSRGVGHGIRSWLPHRTDGVVAPFWPWIAAHFAAADHVIEPETFHVNTLADIAFFQRGKWVNVAITGIFLMLVVLMCAQRLSVLATINLMLLAGLGVLLPRAVYFQPEPIYLCLYFLCWVMALILLESNPLRHYALFGFLCGLTYLAKSSIQPLVAAWFVAMGVRFVGCALPGRWKASTERWHPRHHVIGTLVCAVTFLLVTAPMLSFAYERWGRPFFSYPAAWMWMDDFDKQAYRWMAEHPDKASLDAVPEDEWPSLATYRRTHTPEQTRERLENGIREKIGNFLNPQPTGKNGGAPDKPWKRMFEHRGCYLGGVAFIFLAVCGLTWRRPRDEPPASHPVTPGAGRAPQAPVANPIDWSTPVGRILFVAGTCVASVLAYGWYSPIGRGDRFMISLYLPLVFTFIWAAERRLDRHDRRFRAWRLRWGHAALHALLLAALLWRVSELVAKPYFDPAVR